MAIVRRTKQKGPFIPAEQHETVRHAMVALLREETLSAREISAAVGIGEKEVYGHLEEIQLHKQGLRLSITPATCRSCGFVFAKRERLKRPGKCPVCRGESISQPLFTVEKT